MKVLFLYPNAEGYARTPLGLSIMMSVLRECGHKFDLFDTTFMRTKENLDSALREKKSMVTTTNTSGFYEFHSDSDIVLLLYEKIEEFKPDIIAVSIVEDNYEFTDFLLGAIKYGFDIPIIAGGATPTTAPKIVLENPNIDYIIQGEGEFALLDICDLMEQNKSIWSIQNVWYKNGKKIKGNSLRPLVNLDNLPIQEVKIWNEGHFVKPYDGKLYRSGFIEMSRGCMNNCTYCIESVLRRIHKDTGSKLFRRKSVDAVVKEASYLKEKHRINMVFFTDDNFLFMPLRGIELFGKLWGELDLPYWMNTTFRVATTEKLKILKKSGCCGIGLGVESGSERIRKEVMLRPPASNQDIIDAFERIHKCGIRTTANYILGTPGETEKDIMKTIELHKKIQPKSYDLTIMVPYLGTELHRVCYENGYIETQNKPGFRTMAKRVSMRKNATIETPWLKSKRVNELYNKFEELAK